MVDALPRRIHDAVGNRGRIKDRPWPSLEHMILHSLILIGLVLAVGAATAA